MKKQRRKKNFPALLFSVVFNFDLAAAAGDVHSTVAQEYNN